MNSVKWKLIYASAIIIGVTVVAFLFYALEWWEIIGLLLLKSIMGAKVAGAKSLAKAIVKAGGKKAIAYATGVVLLKRHIIDLLTIFFKKHSFSRYSKSLKKYISIKAKELKDAPLSKKIKNIFIVVSSISP